MQFVVHQILHSVKFLTSQGLVPVNLTLDAFQIDSRMHVQVDVIRILAGNPGVRESSLSTPNRDRLVRRKHELLLYFFLTCSVSFPFALYLFGLEFSLVD